MSFIVFAATAAAPRLARVPLAMRAVGSQHQRAMTILSKDSGEEYKKLVRCHAVHSIPLLSILSFF